MVGIGAALEAVRRDVNEYFRRAQGGRELVVLASPADRNARASETTNNRLLLSLTNVLQETTLRNAPGRNPAGRDTHGEVPPLAVNLQVLFTAHFSDYVTGMDYLTDLVAYLQAKPVFDPANTKGLDPSIYRLAFSMVNLPYAELSYLFGMFHSDYLPSALYDVRMLQLRDPRHGPES